MSNSESNVHFWNHLLATAELMESVDAAQARSMVMEQLSTIHEAFGDCADPVESFEEYVVIKLSQAIHTALTLEENSTQPASSLT
ncbi:MAG: hypothetical protein Q8L60_01365 [Gammaproteobacteria bacterium]|nr:hypothetical protein [Gammaproteobacteria bacterium]MDP2141220.1 hypothetical protein [Gammaproteobacteria bacterium]MDP2349106.1 hypothetical protein [Gammaproteobacteria bacterium]